MVGIAKRIVKRSVRDGGEKADRDKASTRGFDESNREQLEQCDFCRASNDTRSHTISRILGVDELAVFFNCSTEKIKRLARTGELPAFKFGKTWFVREQDLEDHINRAARPKLDPWRER